MKLLIKDLSKTYSNGVQALKDVNLSIGNGMFGLLGPNGAGKSSLMRTIATLQEADHGEITFDGINIKQDKQELRKQLGYLPQEFGVYPKITAEAMLVHLAELKGITSKSERKEVVEALLKKVNLWDVRKKRLGTYSGGMKQRFGIAQALLGNPRLIIVDEPTAGLDPAERNRFHNLLSEIGENTIVILSTHIVDDVSTLCHDMAIICKGEVVLRGNPLEIVEQYKGKVWKKIIEKTQIESYRQEYQVISTRLVLGRTLIHIFSEEAPGNGFEAVEADLEDVYFSEISQKMEVITV